MSGYIEAELEYGKDNIKLKGQGRVESEGWSDGRGNSYNSSENKSILDRPNLFNDLADHVTFPGILVAAGVSYAVYLALR